MHRSSIARPLARCQTGFPLSARRLQSSSSVASAKDAPQKPMQPKKAKKKVDDDATNQKPDLRYPRSLQALHLAPLRRVAEHGIPSCDLQIRSFSMQPLEFFADFALRVAYYLGLPAYGPIPLPRITQRWTVPRSHFIFKKSQENFERMTMRRLVQIRDGHPETVQLWLAYLRKHQYYGVGLKANMWEFSDRGVGKAMDAAQEGMRAAEEPWAHLGQTRSVGTADKVDELLSSRRFMQAAGLKEAPPRSTEPYFWNQEEGAAGKTDKKASPQK